MSFDPINDDHAVQSVTFSVLFDRPLDQRTIVHVQSSHDRWRPDLPAVQAPQIFGIEIGAGGSPRQINGHGVEFSYLRPDGTPAWQLRFEGQAIHVECTRYTRWERIWQVARGHLETALAVIEEGSFEAQSNVIATTLQYVDRFSTSDVHYDLSLLLTHNEYIPPRVFAQGDLWHAHQGWFDRSHDLGPLLNNLNLDARHEPPDDQSRILITLLHLQQLRYAEHLSLTSYREQISNQLDAVMQSLHEKNKALISSILSEDMKNRIGLSAVNLEEHR